MISPSTAARLRGQGYNRMKRSIAALSSKELAQGKINNTYCSRLQWIASFVLPRALSRAPVDDLFNHRRRWLIDGFMPLDLNVSKLQHRLADAWLAWRSGDDLAGGGVRLSLFGYVLGCCCPRSFPLLLCFCITIPWRFVVGGRFARAAFFVVFRRRHFHSFSTPLSSYFHPLSFQGRFRFACSNSAPTSGGPRTAGRPRPCRKSRGRASAATSSVGREKR